MRSSKEEDPINRKKKGEPLAGPADSSLSRERGYRNCRKIRQAVDTRWRNYRHHGPPYASSSIRRKIKTKREKRKRDFPGPLLFHSAIRRGSRRTRAMGARAREARPPHYSLVEIDIYSCPASSVGCDNKYIRKEHLRDLKDRTHYPQQEDAELFFVSLSLSCLICLSGLSLLNLSFPSLLVCPVLSQRRRRKRCWRALAPFSIFKIRFFFNFLAHVTTIGGGDALSARAIDFNKLSASSLLFFWKR